ncbi:carbohydrate ABC transporter permease [Streptomyces abyssalis]|uniref:carbohydrate ABC transporter permease n=1 Tax=Streptomyces abyssalis TaxID=933944 RepID=UPI0009A0496C|nr:sugar ABC transporter permease [Streptomyces abyssalis]
MTAPAPAPARPAFLGRTRAASHTDNAARPGALYAVPAILVFGVFALVPLVLVGWLSFTTWNGLGDPRWTGLGNWRDLITDPGLLHSLRITAVLTIAGWAVQTPLALLLGVWAAGAQRGRAVASALVFLPLLLSGAATALVWKALLDPNFGLAGSVGPWVGMPDGNLLGTAGGALTAIIAVGAWQFVPFHMLMYQAAARNVPAHLYEAATIDGAGRVRQFWSITLPQLRNTVVTSSTLMIVGSMTTFETILILTDGGPGAGTQSMPFRMYQQAFKSFEMGPASALATVLVLFGTALSLLIVRFSGFSRMRSTLEGI